jgi:hypothetical protein
MYLPPEEERKKAHKVQFICLLDPCMPSKPDRFRFGGCPFRRDPGVEQYASSHAHVHTALAPQSTSPSHATDKSPSDGPHSPIETPDAVPAPCSNQNDAGSGFLDGAVGLQPSSLLNRQAMKGKFSIQNILSTNHNLNLDKPKDPVAFPADDPINAGVIPYHLATSLFDGFVSPAPNCPTWQPG